MNRAQLMNRTTASALLTVGSLVASTMAAANTCTRHHKVPASSVPSAPGVQKVVFVAKDLRTGSCWHTDRLAAQGRHPPWSTFKIPHFLIALETGAVIDSDEVLTWNADRRPPEPYWPNAWKQDQSLRTAFKVSAAWPFQDLVSRVGQANYTKWLQRFRFGNARAPAGQDDFWLGGPLAVSAMEQVEFLSCLAATGCGASAPSVGQLEEAAVQDDTGHLRMFAKTGSGPIKPKDYAGNFEGWYVGYIRGAQGEALFAFATFVQSDSYAALRTYRERATRQLLSDLGFLSR